MQIYSLAQFFTFINSGHLRGGDIIFVATPQGTGKPAARMIKGAQFLRSSLHGHKERGFIPYHQFTHVAIVVQKVIPRGIDTFIVESDPSHTREVTLNKFFTSREDKEFSLFRTHIPKFSRLINYYADILCHSHIRYFSAKANIKSLKSKVSAQIPVELPSSTNCSSFVSFVYDFACYYGNLSHFTMPMNHTHIAPYLLYHFFKERERNERTWEEVLQVLQ